MSPEVRSWWAGHFLPGKYPGATEHLYIWNDMNEPSVFNGPEARRALPTGQFLCPCHIRTTNVHACASWLEGSGSNACVVHGASDDGS